MINSQDIKIGSCVRLDGKLYFCIDFQHVKPGKGNTIMRVKLKCVTDGRVLEHQYLYKEGEDLIFMNNETFEQIPLSPELVTGVEYMKEGDTVELVVDASTENVLFGEMPVKTKLKVTYTEPGIKGDTATNTLKPATLETGAEVRVPLFIEEGAIIEIDTRDGSYQGRER